MSSQVQSPDHSVDYCSGCGWCTTACPAGREDRGDEQPGACPPARGQVAQAPRLGARPDGPHRLARRHLLPARQLRLRQRAHPGGDAGHRAASTARRRCPSSRSARSPRRGSARAASVAWSRTRCRGRTRRSSTSTAARPTTTSRTSAEAAIEVLGGTASRRSSPTGLLRPAADQQRPVRPGAGTGPDQHRRPRRLRARRAIGSSAPRRRAPTRSRPSTRRCSTSTTTTRRSWPTRPGTSASSSSTSTTRAGSTPTSASSTRTCPYHAPCQLRSHGIGLPALDLFALVPGLRAIDMDHDCCGIAGTYGLKKREVRRSRWTSGRRCSRRSRRPAPRPRRATRRPAAGRSRPRRASAPATRSRSSLDAYRAGDRAREGATPT